MKSEFGVDFDWIGYELWPEGLAQPPSVVAPAPNPDRPLVPSRLEFAYTASGVSKPRYTNQSDDIHNALEAVEHAKGFGVSDQVVERLYTALWMEGLEINQMDVLVSLADGMVPDVAHMMADIEGRVGSANIVSFDDQAYSLGVYNLPTYFIGDKKYAEQPYFVLERALRSVLE